MRKAKNKMQIDEDTSFRLKDIITVSAITTSISALAANPRTTLDESTRFVSAKRVDVVTDSIFDVLNDYKTHLTHLFDFDEPIIIDETFIKRRMEESIFSGIDINFKEVINMFNKLRPSHEDDVSLSSLSSSKSTTISSKSFSSNLDSSNKYSKIDHLSNKLDDLSTFNNLADKVAQEVWKRQPPPHFDTNPENQFDNQILKDIKTQIDAMATHKPANITEVAVQTSFFEVSDKTDTQIEQKECGQQTSINVSCCESSSASLPIESRFSSIPSSCSFSRGEVNESNVSRNNFIVYEFNEDGSVANISTAMRKENVQSLASEPNYRFNHGLVLSTLRDLKINSTDVEPTDYRNQSNGNSQLTDDGSSTLSAISPIPTSD
uniref:Uncharacterized protein n=1 Tax=Rhabditophanes sp. KR3021 TaxID=114890 RepID=A0AC35TU42_9BILA